MDEADSGTELQLLCAPPADAEISVRALTRGPADNSGVDDPAAESAVEPGYSCSLCGSSWPYQAVRNTGRCPGCGGGLRRGAADA